MEATHLTRLKPTPCTWTQGGPLSQSHSLVITAPLLSSDNFLMDSTPAPRQTPVGPRVERGRPAFCISVIIPFAHAVLTFCLAPGCLPRTPLPAPPLPPPTNAGRCDMHTNALSLVNKYGMKNEWRCISLQVTLGVQVTRRQEKCAAVGDKSVWITKVRLA